MHFQSQLLYKLTFGTFLMLWAHSTSAADMLRDGGDSLNSLYDNLLQREYIGPIAFPNHQVERKAQRSPSLRLRFGRRSDPEMMTQLPEKRWFGDVNQKPIRSPSLRLRFGRRSDPTMPLHSPFDLLMNARQNADASNSASNTDDYNDIFDNYYERVVRKPQRLRFGRSLPYQSDLSASAAASDNYESQNVDDSTVSNNGDDDFYNTLLHSQKLRNLLLTLRQFQEANSPNNNDESSSMENDMDEFERAIRKPAPLRLRWGRSTGGRSSQMMNEDKTKVELDEKKKLSPISNNVEKTDNQQQQQQNKD
ncbi:short neuropeptide F [Musca domestica]|uniref:Short neuropeptide F n=1 Tax=Musca domestica TaxID=7370 RepID=A0ABM3VJW9_MUSDO|nr:short neuropeptide F [Musca domestica]XP_058985898.1 short neuropeptide F [Musca domestica]